jgi:serine-type D-Ala-D-Ala carboxypeptidase (penicillin-binding protein 5/6)
MKFPSLILATLCMSIAAPAQEDLDAPPLVTARAWAIADGASGEYLWGWNADEPLKAASTAKIMCAMVVLRLVEKNPAVLGEVVTFSQLADDTPGSTAEIKVGEQVTVRDGLYALLLPSGNDMGNALAEHFHSRLAPPDETSPPELTAALLATRCHFVAEMNRVARTLGLQKTRYRNPYGDGGTVDDRTTTARDLLVVTHAAMKDALFREIVATESHATEVRQPDGAPRELRWFNTNKLLVLPGYDGVKTGNTDSARSCLVASGARGERRLLVVVLGSATDEARYVDARNLFRWAWRKLGVP